jgi:plastocyanin
VIATKIFCLIVSAVLSVSLFDQRIALASRITSGRPALRPMTRTSAGSGAQQGTGQISGRVSFEGNAPSRARITMDKDPVCLSAHREPLLAEDGEVNGDGTLPNVFVYVKSVAKDANFTAPDQPVILDQRGCVYQPHVLGLMVGQELQIISSDPTTHNIHPLPRDNQEWNQSQPPGAAPLTKKFTRPEVTIPVKCNQHPWMKAYIGVTSNPFYSVTGKADTFTIKGLPAGKYTIEAWTATFGTETQEITVQANQSVSVDFTFRAH